jgi:peroxiredoxin
MPELGGPAPDFALPDTAGVRVCRDDFAGAPALLVAFWCNHCPYVKHIREVFTALVHEYQERGLAAVAINANDASAYPDDGPEQMRIEAARFVYSFPYLYDENQDVARAYQAACTPDLFLYDAQRRLVYRGQFDDSRPGNDRPVTGADLRAAFDAVLAGQPVPGEQRPGIGCNIKWKPGSGPA